MLGSLVKLFNTIMKEQWKQSDFADGRYIISNLGRIINCTTGGFVKPMINNSGYYKLTNSFSKENCYIHREVAKLFIGNIPEGFIVNHKDGNKLNNSVYNLEIVSQSSNIKHSLQILRYGRIKLFDSDKDSIANLLSKNVKISRIAELYGVHKSTMGKFIKRNNLNIEIISSQDL